LYVHIGMSYVYFDIGVWESALTLILLMWRIWWTPNNASRWNL